MTDIAHVMGGDLSLSPSGDLATATDVTETEQRVLRRLMTNPRGYVWHQSYGAGFPALVGTTITADQVRGIAVQQMAMEEGVAQSPPPGVTTSQDQSGNVTATITFVTDAGATGTVPVVIA